MAPASKQNDIVVSYKLGDTVIQSPSYDGSIRVLLEVLKEVRGSLKVLSNWKARKLLKIQLGKVME